MTSFPFFRRVLPLATILAAGYSQSGAQASPAATASTLTATPQRLSLSVGDCDDPYVVRSVALGGRVEIRAPKDWHVEEALSLDASELPVTNAPAGGATKHTWKLAKDEPERYLRRGRFLLVQDDGSSSAQCNVDVLAAGWSRVDAQDWIPGRLGDFEQSKDLGSIAGGLVLAGVLHGGPDFGATFTVVAGDPTRSGRIGREGQWVYETPGDYKVDVVSFANGYGRMTTHVSFAIRP